MAGNSVLLKHAQHKPLCAERLAAAASAAGLPNGFLQAIHTSHDATARLIRNDGIAHVAFTGSVPGGRAMEEAAAGRFIGVGLELGGKDPAYVRHDADLDHAVENLVDGAFFNSGQSCCGIERIYVHEKLFDGFVQGAAELTQRYVLGNPTRQDTTLGPMVRTSAADFVRGQIRDDVAAGARALIDESKFPASQPGTPYLAPQILVGVDHRMRVT